MFPRRMIVFPTLTLIVGLAVAIYLGVTSNIAVAQDEEPEFTTDFRLEDCKFHSKGENPYFFLKSRNFPSLIRARYRRPCITHII